MGQKKGATWKLSEVTKSKMRKPKSKEHRDAISRSKLGDKNPSWKGGKTSSTGDGYIRVLLHGHPNANSRGYVLEHRLVMSNFLGRALSPSEFVHHIDKNRANNSIENLEIMTKSEHARKHIKETNKNWVYIGSKIECPNCGHTHIVSNKTDF